MTVKKTAISLQEDVFNYGSERASRLFGGIFSSYVGYLISRDREQLSEPVQKKKDNKMSAAINQILDL